MRYSWFGYWGRQAAALALALSAVAVVVWVLPPKMYLVKYAILTVVSLAAVAIALSAYAKADEVILQTHKTAWFWGSLGSLALMPPLMIAVFERELPIPTLLPIRHSTPADWFAEGILTLLALQCIGFLLLWAYYNIRRWV